MHKHTTVAKMNPAMEPSHTHRAHFYDEGAFPHLAIAQFLAAGLQEKETALIIATTKHANAIRSELSSLLNLKEIEASGRLNIYSASTLLERFYTGDRPNWERASSLIKPILDQAIAASPVKRVRVFGELVALLSARSDFAGAIELERLWNELLKTRPLQLYCAYPIQPFVDSTRSRQFNHICAEHDEVVPVLTWLDDSGQANRRLAILQQQSVSLQAEIAARKQVEAELRESREQLRALAAHLQIAREEERLAIARELHDELAQRLAATKMDVRRLARQLNHSADEGQVPREPALEALDNLASTIDQVIGSIRTLVSGLRLDLLDEAGLGAAVEWQVRQFEERTGIPCQFHSGVDKVDWERNRSITVCRVLQESLTNVAQHAEATRVDVRLGVQDKHLRLLVRDNGRGIRNSETHKAGHFGILGMKERILLLGGDMLIRGRPGRGTIVSVRVPVLARKSSHNGDGATMLMQSQLNRLSNPYAAI